MEHPHRTATKSLPHDLRLCDQFETFPAVETYNQIFHQAPLPFSVSDPLKIKSIGGYESFIDHYGTIPTREDSWHDFYNAMMWHLFPKAKMAIHNFQISCQGTGVSRSPLQNGMTLFDESGVIIITTEPWVVELISAHNWSQLFIDNRNVLSATSEVYTFGHGLFERYRNPYIGLTAKCLVYEVEPEIMSRSLMLKYGMLDNFLVERLPFTPKKLLPLPILGWPQWWQDNNHQNFYQNRDYFRPKKGS